MKAAVYHRYGPPEVLQIEEIEKPIPKGNEVLINMRATSVCSGEVRMRKPDPPVLVRLMNGFKTPKRPILGVEIAGVVEAVGKNVTTFNVGDHIFGSTNDYCGTYAEHICMPEDGVLTIKPESMSWEQAAATFFGGHTALHFLRKGKIKKGDSVLIIGASGSLSTNAVQLAKHFGAKVSGVCSGSNVELVKSLGADYAIDYKKEDFTKNGKTYNIIFDTQGKSSFSGSLRSLKKNGFYLRAVHLSPAPMLYGLWTNISSSKKVIGGVAHEFREDLIYLKNLVEEGKLKPVIDRIFPLEQIVDAHSYVETGHKKGNVVVTISHD